MCSLFYLFFYFFATKATALLFTIIWSILTIDIFLQVYVNNAFSIFNFIVSVISICDFQIQYLPSPHHAVQFALPMFSFLFLLTM